MKRIELLKAAPALVLAGCAAPIATTRGIIVPSGPRANCGNQWQFDWHAMPKAGGHGYANAYLKQGASCAWTAVGGIALDFIINKGGGFDQQNISFWSGNDSLTFQLDQLQATFSKGAIVKLFKKWYYQVAENGRDGALYKNDGTLLAQTSSAKYLTTSTITEYDPAVIGTGAPQQDYTNWGGVWQKYGVEPDISLACAAALGLEFGCSVTWVLSALGTLAGPLEWFGFVGATVALFSSAAIVLSECNK